MLEDVNRELSKLAEIAMRTQLRYLIVGGMAMNLHGLGRYTSDGDIYVEKTEANWQRLMLTLNEMSYDAIDLQLVEQAHLNNEVVTFSISGPIDIMSRLHYKFQFDELYSRASFYTIDQITYPVISLVDLREVKVLARRPVDLKDVLMIDQHFVKLKNTEIPKKKWWKF
jgi:hypothetical protein